MGKWLCFWITPFSENKKIKCNNSHSLNCQYVILILVCFYYGTKNRCRYRTVTTEYVILTMFNSLRSYMFCIFCGMFTHTVAFILHTWPPNLVILLYKKPFLRYSLRPALVCGFYPVFAFSKCRNDVCPQRARSWQLFNS